MKIRNGFVSNSSSSSFCILGVQMKNTDKKSYIPGLKMEEGIYDYCEDEVFKGLYPWDIGDNETILQAKERILKILKENGIERKLEDIRWFIDGGYDG